MIAINRQTTRVALGAGRHRHRVVVQCEKTGPKAGFASRKAFAYLADVLATQPDLWLCGSEPPDSVLLVFQDDAWSAIAEATVLEGD